MFGSLFDDEWLRHIQKQAELWQSIQRSVNLDAVRMIYQAGERQRYQLDQIARAVDAMRVPLAVGESIETMASLGQNIETIASLGQNIETMASLGQNIETVARIFDALPTWLFEDLQQMQTAWLGVECVTASFARLQQQLAVDLTQLLQEQMRPYQMLVDQEQNKFNEAFVLCADYMFYAALRVVKNTDDAQEAVQDAYIKAVVSLATHGLRNKEPKALRNWFYTIAKNTALDMLRQRKHLVSYEEIGIDVALQSSFKQPEANLLCQELYQEVRKGFLALSEIQHKAIFMRYFGKEDGWDAIAAFLECPPSSARTHHTRGIRILRKHLEKYVASMADLTVIMDAFVQERLCVDLHDSQDG